MVDGLTLLDERSQQFVQQSNLILGGIDALSRGDERLLVSFLCRQGPVIVPVCRAASLVLATIADIGCPCEFLALERDEFRTMPAAVAVSAKLPAVLLLADILFSASLCGLAVIRYVIKDYCFIEYSASSDFLGYGSRVSMQGITYLLE